MPPMLARRSARPRALVLAGLVASAACNAMPSAPQSTATGAGGAAVLFGQGGAPATVCEPGAQTTCYEGPDGTLGLGACHDGVKTCKPDGSGFGACEGQVLPAKAENCDTPVDDDCDGSTSNGCGCKPGATKDCYEGPAGTAGLGQCKGGTKTCSDDGSGYGPCVGQVLPAAENCDTPDDEDCDGSGACQSGGTQASKIFGGAGDQQVLGMAMTSGGELVVVGRFQGTVDFGGGALTSAGGDDVFVVRFWSNGSFAWAERFGDAGDQRANAVAVDMAGNVFVAGGFGGTLDFGKSKITSAGGTDGFVAAFDKSGNHLWARAFGDASDQEALGVSSSQFGDVTVVGRFTGTANFGGGDLASAGGHDAFAAGYDVAGSYAWSKAFGDPGEQTAFSVATDPSGNAWITGSTAGTVDFGGGPLAAKADDAFVLKLGSNGGHLASHLYGGAESQAGRAIAVDATGAPVFGGSTLGPLDLGTGPLACGQGTGLFLARLDANGATTSAACFGAPSPGLYDPLGLAFASNGDVVATGGFQGKLDLGALAIQSAGGLDVFYARFSGALVPSQAHRYGGAGDQVGRAAVGDPSSAAWIGGSFAGTIDVGAKPVPTLGGDDAFLAKLAP
jgi:hypothetical protein